MRPTYEVSLPDGERLPIHEREWPVGWEAGRYLPPPPGDGRNCLIRQSENGQLLVHGMTWPAESATRIASIGELFDFPTERSTIESAVHRVLEQIEYKLNQIQEEDLEVYLDELF